MYMETVNELRAAEEQLAGEKAAVRTEVQHLLEKTRQDGQALLEQTKQEQMMVREGNHGEGRGEHDEAWKSQITPLSAVNYAVIGGAVAGAGPLLLVAGRRLAL